MNLLNQIKESQEIQNKLANEHWHVDEEGDIYNEFDDQVASIYNYDIANFIAESRQRWPEDTKKLEEAAKILKEIHKTLTEMNKTDPAEPVAIYLLRGKIGEFLEAKCDRNE
jgi:hypothetical protein